MFRTILKVIYIGLAMFIGMIMYMGTYQSNGFQAILDRANGYIEEENYDELARMLGGLVNKNEVMTFEEATKENQMLLYEGTTLSSYNTYKENADKKETYDTIENIQFNDAYFLLVLNPKFETKHTAGEKITNKSSLVFTTADESKSYEYKLVQNNEINKDFYSEFPKTINDAVLGGSRDMIALEEAYGFYSIIIDEALIKAVNETLGTPVTGFHLADNEGKMVENTSREFNFTFESQFFTDMEPLAKEYDKYLDAYLRNKAGDLDKKKFEEVSKSFQTFTDDFDKKLTEQYTDYAKGFEQKELIGSSVAWKTIGQVTIYGVIAIILYFLLFKFSQVCAMFSALYCKITGKKSKYAPRAKSSKTSTPMAPKANVNRETVVKTLPQNDAKEEAKPASENVAEAEVVADDNASEDVAEAEVVAEVVNEEPLSEVVADAPLEDAEVVEEEPKEDK